MTKLQLPLHLVDVQLLGADERVWNALGLAGELHVGPLSHHLLLGHVDQAAGKLEVLVGQLPPNFVFHLREREKLFYKNLQIFLNAKPNVMSQLLIEGTVCKA